MKKSTLVIFFLSTFYFFSNAQITLTASDFPQIGESFTTVNCVPDQTISVGNSGANQVYDFSMLQPVDSSTTSFVDPSTTPGFSEFPNATLAAGEYFYIQETSDAFYQLGIYSDTSMNGSGQYLAIPFNPTSKFFEIPTTYNTNFTDDWGFSITIPSPAPPADSIRQSSLTTRDVLFDGYGTVTTPDGSFDGLRERVYETNTTVTEVLAFGIWSEIDNQVSSDTSYNWYAENSGGQLVSISILNGEISGISYTAIAPVPMAPIANFSSMTMAGGLVNFTDLSTNLPTSWLWDFGDGATSTDQNPTHTYATAGDYTVCLTVTNSLGSDMVCQSVTISFAPIADYGFSFALGGGIYDFTDLSTNNPTTWAWDFGDGNTSTMQNPQNTYTSPGIYTVCLTVTNSSGSDMVCGPVEVIFAPVAIFNVSAQNNSTFDFLDQSINDPESWLWDFGDGNTSTDQNPSHTYSQAGTYTVCLTVSNSVGMNTTCFEIEVIFAPSAAFTYVDQGAGVLDFTDASSNNPTTWAWDFNDSNTSTDQNPQHSYTTTGTYDVCLTVSNDAGSDMTCQMIDVIITATEEPYAPIEVRVFPNPVKETLHLELESRHFENLHFQLYNSIGQPVLEKQIESDGMYTINVEKLATGMYYFVLRGEEGAIRADGSVLKGNGSD